jgi:hypothetical protein
VQQSVGQAAPLRPGRSWSCSAVNGALSWLFMYPHCGHPCHALNTLSGDQQVPDCCAPEVHNAQTGAQTRNAARTLDTRCLCVHPTVAHHQLPAMRFPALFENKSHSDRGPRQPETGAPRGSQNLASRTTNIDYTSSPEVVPEIYVPWPIILQNRQSAQMQDCPHEIDVILRTAQSLVIPPQTLMALTTSSSAGDLQTSDSTGRRQPRPCGLLTLGGSAALTCHSP